MTRAEFVRLISEKIKLARVEADYTQDRMAEILGISKKTLIQIEKGRISAGWTVAVAFCALFKDSAVVQSVLSSDPLEITAILAFDHCERPKEMTMGGKLWWRELAQEGRFRLQQNLVSLHYRILDDHDRRWCSSFDDEYMQKRLRELGTKANSSSE